MNERMEQEIRRTIRFLQASMPEPKNRQTSVFTLLRIAASEINAWLLLGLFVGALSFGLVSVRVLSMPMLAKGLPWRLTNLATATGLSRTATPSIRMPARCKATNCGASAMQGRHQLAKILMMRGCPFIWAVFRPGRLVTAPSQAMPARPKGRGCGPAGTFMKVWADRKAKAWSLMA